MGTGHATYAAALMLLASTALGCGSDDENPPPGETDPCAGFEDDADALVLCASLSCGDQCMTLDSYRYSRHTMTTIMIWVLYQIQLISGWEFTF